MLSFCKLWRGGMFRIGYITLHDVISDLRWGYWSAYTFNTKNIEKSWFSRYSFRCILSGLCHMSQRSQEDTAKLGGNMIVECRICIP